MKRVSAKDLGIDLASRKESDLFKWLFASLLFGKPIQQQVAVRTYEVFQRAGMLGLEKIANANWNRLVELLDQGHYVRYDFSTADKLQDVCKALKSRYGSVTNLLAESCTKPKLMKSLEEFKGVGPVTARIFVREVAPLLTSP